MQSEPFDVLLVGLGAVGGIYAYVLEKSSQCRVTAIARSLYTPIMAHGITIKSKKYGQINNWMPHRLTRTPQEAADRKYRFIICCFKCLPDVEPTATTLAPFLIPSSHSSSEPATLPTVVLIQNGIGIEQPLAEAFPSIHIISCVAWIGANLKMAPSGPKSLPSHIQTTDPQPSPVIEHGLLDQLIFGIYQGEGFTPTYGNNPHAIDLGPCNRFVEGLLTDDRSPLVGSAREERLRRGKEEVERFASLLRAGGGNPEVVEHIQPARWAKNLWNGSFSTMCALSRAPVATLIAPEVLPYTLPVVRRAMLEILYVGRALGYRESDLPAKLIDEAIQLTIQNYQTKPASPSAPAVAGPGAENKESTSSKSAGADKRALEATDLGDVFEEDDEEEATGLNPLAVPLFKPSMLIDLELGRPMELEPILGAVLDRARSKAIETPRLDLLYSVLKVLQEQAARSHAAKLKTQEQEKHLHAWAMRKPSVGGSGTSDSRQAWLSEVDRRARLGQAEHSMPGVSRTQSSSQVPSKGHKVVGKPLA